MARRRRLTVTAVLGLLVIVAVVVLAAAFAVPVAIVVVSAVLALAVGALRPQLRSRPPRWRADHASRPGRHAWPTAAAPPQPPGPTWTTTWETLPPPSEISAVRGRVGALLTEWGLDGDAAQPTLLVITELLTNAIEHAFAPIHLSIEWGHTFVRVQVHDSAPGAPPAPIRDPQAARGHGLQIVEGLALRRGWTPEQHGKTVWADLPTDWPA